MDVTYRFSGFCLDPVRRLLFGQDGQPVALKPRVLDTLLYLVEHRGELLEKRTLLDAIWPNVVVEENNLNQAISTLRRIFGEKRDEHRFIVTEPGRGYRFVASVEVSHSTGTEPPVVSTATTRVTGAPDPGIESKRPMLPVAMITAVAVAAAVALAAAFGFGPQRSQPQSLVGAAITAQPLTWYPGEEATPALEPNGARAAFSWREPAGNSGIFVTQVGFGAPVRLSDAGRATDTDPAWSPDGGRIAFLRRHDDRTFDVMVMSALGGTAQRVYRGQMWPISGEGSPLLGWTPDGLALLFTTARVGDTGGWNYGLHRLALESGALEDLRLDEPGRHYDTSPAVSPDGRWLAFTRYKQGERLNQIMLAPLGPGLVVTSRPEPIPDLEPKIYHSLHWSPTSDRLWFAAAGQVIEWPLGGKAATVDTLGAAFANPIPIVAQPWMSIVARRRGAQAAVVVPRTDSDLFALAIDPVTHQALGTPEVRAKSSGVDYHPRISPDGKALAFISDRTGPRDVWLADPDGSNARRLTSVGRVGQLIVGYPRWAPDSKSIAFHSSAPGEERVIYRVDVESAVTTLLFNGCCPGGWSADGRSLYVTEIGDVIYIARVDVETGHRERLVEGGTATETADGQFLLFSRARERGYFRWPLYDKSGRGEAVRLVSDYTPSVGGIAPVADGFYYIGLTDDSVPRAIRFYDYARGEANDVAPVPARTSIGLTVSPDGRELMYAAIDGPPEADIVLLDFASARRD